MKTVKMIFSRDVFYNDPTVPKYEAGKSYDIPEDSVEKWLKRGAQIVSEVPKEVQASPVPVPEPVAPPEQERIVEEEVSDEEVSPRSYKKKSSKEK